MRHGNSIFYRKLIAWQKANNSATIFFGAAILVSCLLSLVPRTVHAATVTVVASASTVTVGVPFRVDVDLDTQGDSANAIQGTISFPTSLFTVEAVNDGNSIISFWIEQPEETTSGTVSFSGIVPGGFEGSASSVVGLVLDPIATGTGTIALQDIQLLRNDGQGSSIPALATAATVTVFPAASGTVPLPPTVSFVTPESFVPMISEDPNVYGGKYFLVFSTIDKGTGIDHYEVLEVPTGKMSKLTPTWRVATSPYLLEDQSLSSDIYVRAIDHAGNAIVVKVSARYPASSRTKIYWDIALFLFAVILVAALATFFRRRRRVVR